MSEAASVAAVTLFAEDPKRSKEFYGRAFEREPVYEDEAAVTFRLDNVLVNLLRREEAPELVEPATIAAAGMGPNVLLTLSVEDVDAAVEQLTARGVELLNGPVDRPWGVRTACFADPDGHAWELAGPLRT
jgi:catechol 2,3-dioxygenase-like lactoylglutathione lyase family enzyme